MVAYNIALVDTDNDGTPDSKYIDTTGDGKGDTVMKLHDAELRSFCDEITRRKQLFELASEVNSEYDQILSITIIIITSVGGLLAFISSSSFVQLEERSKWSLIIGGISTVSSILGGLQRTLKFGTKEQMYLQAANDYRLLETQVRFVIQSGKKVDQEWWNSVEQSVLDFQKNLQFYPSLSQVKKWTAKGLLQPKKVSDLKDIVQDSETIKKLEKLGVKDIHDLVYLCDDTLRSLKLSEVVVRKIKMQQLANMAREDELNENDKKKAKKALNNLQSLSYVPKTAKVTPLDKIDKIMNELI